MTAASSLPRLVGTVLGTTGSRGAWTLARADVLASTGARHAARRLASRRSEAALFGPLRDRVYERIWREAAAAAGASVTTIGEGILEIRRDERATLVWQQVTALDDPVTLRRALDKSVVHALVGAAGVPVPEHLEFSARRPEAAFEFLRRAGAPCVVKPAMGTGGGVSVTGAVRSPADLARSVLRAARAGDRLLIERQVEGDVYRLLFLDGELLGVVRHRPPTLTGDGRSSIMDLIAAENARRLSANGDAGLSPLLAHLDTVLTLRGKALTLRSVPAAGQQVTIQTVTNDNRLEDAHVEHGEPAPGLVEVARDAAAAVGLRLAGVDVITVDPSRHPAEVGGAIPEVNGTPGLHHHYHVANAVVPVAVPILERLLEGAYERAV